MGFIEQNKNSLGSWSLPLSLSLSLSLSLARALSLGLLDWVLMGVGVWIGCCALFAFAFVSEHWSNQVDSASLPFFCFFFCFFFFFDGGKILLFSWNDIWRSLRWWIYSGLLTDLQDTLLLTSPPPSSPPVLTKPLPPRFSSSSFSPSSYLSFLLYIPLLPFPLM